ncbi:hypothetical protein NGM37_40320, partial [Streptomyces sp. TRM76130]|nr:hypothetical protein [Streptomyces sp. TRM76130]
RGLRDADDLATTDTALVDDVCDRYTRAHRLTDAVTLRRAHFDAHPSRLTYRQLRTAAQAADCWPTERERAQASLRADTAPRPPHRGGSLLVDILLDEDETDAAWRTATETGADDSQWRT